MQAGSLYRLLTNTCTFIYTCILSMMLILSIILNQQCSGIGQCVPMFTWISSDIVKQSKIQRAVSGEAENKTVASVHILMDNELNWRHQSSGLSLILRLILC